MGRLSYLFLAALTIVNLLLELYNKYKNVFYRFNELINGKNGCFKFVLDKNIEANKKDIERIDQNIDNIRSQKSVVNNYYDQKAREIPGMTNKQIDSSFRKRYDY